MLGEGQWKEEGEGKKAGFLGNSSIHSNVCYFNLKSTYILLYLACRTRPLEPQRGCTCTCQQAHHTVYFFPFFFGLFPRFFLGGAARRVLYPRQKDWSLTAALASLSLAPSSRNRLSNSWETAYSSRFFLCSISSAYLSSTWGMRAKVGPLRQGGSGGRPLPTTYLFELCEVPLVRRLELVEIPLLVLRVGLEPGPPLDCLALLCTGAFPEESRELLVDLALERDLLLEPVDLLLVVEQLHILEAAVPAIERVELLLLVAALYERVLLGVLQVVLQVDVVLLQLLHLVPMGTLRMGKGAHRSFFAHGSDQPAARQDRPLPCVCQGNPGNPPSRP